MINLELIEKIIGDEITAVGELIKECKASIDAPTGMVPTKDMPIDYHILTGRILELGVLSEKIKAAMDEAIDSMAKTMNEESSQENND
jgi:hypothetical protein